jgi:hypothetical protein
MDSPDQIKIELFNHLFGHVSSIPSTPEPPCFPQFYFIIIIIFFLILEFAFKMIVRNVRL